MTSALHWTWARFDDLGVHALHDALALRCRVFILEQGPYQDPDDADKHAWHLLGRSTDRSNPACALAPAPPPWAACINTTSPWLLLRRYMDGAACGALALAPKALI